jgi:hypothetical protein
MDCFVCPFEVKVNNTFQIQAVIITDLSMLKSICAEAFLTLSKFRTLEGLKTIMMVNISILRNYQKMTRN